MNDLHSSIDGIVKAGIFDEKWYLMQYPDVSLSGLSPIEHYVKYGVRLRRKPNPMLEAQIDMRNAWSCDAGSIADTATLARSGAFSPERGLQLKSAAEEAEENAACGAEQPGAQEGRTREAAPLETCSEQEMDLEQLSNSFSVEQLKLKLWGGFSRYAVDCLERIKNDCRRDSADRAEAAYCLMQWFYVAENFSRAYENSLLYGMLCETFLDKKFVIGSTLCLIKLRRYGEANKLINTALDDRTRSAIYLSDYLFLKASIVRSMNPGEQGETQQIELYASAFQSMGLAPVEKMFPDAPFTFGNLKANATARITDQRQKVSIIIPAFNAAGSITYVIRSLQAQTWRNIEIIVVDDCSPDNTSEVVSEIMAFDPRVKLIRKPVNEGAYPARNTGLKEATGDLIMVHDSDDWSHPQKLEVQIRALSKAEGAVASMSNWIRVDDEFMPSVHSRPRNTIKSLSFPSLLFKREIIEQIGPWAAVRVSGDAEFKTRIERYYGSEAIVRIAKVLSISLSRDGSLTQSSATHINTLHFGVRWQYLNLYDFFHGLQLKYDPGCEKCAAVSNAVVGNRSKRAEESESFDYVFVSDFVSDVSLIRYIAAACAAGAKVGVYHWRDFEEDAAQPVSKQLYELCLQHKIGLLTCSDSLNAKLVIFGNLEILRFRQDRFPSISTSKLIGLLQKTPRIFSSPAQEQKALVQLKATIKALFGKEMRLVPGSPRLANSLRKLGLQEEINGEPLLPAVDTLFWCDRPIKGCGSPKKLLEIAYPRGAWIAAPFSRDMQIDAEINHENLLGTLEGCPEAELRYREIAIDEMSISAIKNAISGAEFYIFFPQAEDYDEFGSGVLEAMALGIPVILPLELESVFGGSALYAEPGKVAALIREIWEDQDRYLACARNGREFVRAHFSPNSLSGRMNSLLAIAAAG